MKHPDHPIFSAFYGFISDKFDKQIFGKKRKRLAAQLEKQKALANITLQQGPVE